MKKLYCLLLALAALPAYAANLKWAAQNDILTLDPHSQNHATTNAMMQHTYEGLTRYNKQYQPEPCLATGWKQLSDTHWRFNLRKGVKFHDGSPLTADDVVFSFGRIQQKQGTMQIYVTGVKEVVKVDDHTVDFILSGPVPILLRNIVDFRIMSKSWAEKTRSQNVQDYAKKEETHASRNTNGTGPYMIKGWAPDKEITFVAHKGWWGKLDGNVTDVVYNPVKSDATRVSALLAGRRRPGHRPAGAGRRSPAQGAEAQGARRPRGAHHLHRHGPAQQGAQVLRASRARTRSRTCACGARSTWRSTARRSSAW